MPKNSNTALSNAKFVEEIADCYALIAESLHTVLRELSDQVNVSTEKAYGLITEEYGLRTRLGILRADAKNRTVAGVTINHENLIKLLNETAVFIRKSRSLDDISYVLNTATVLCISFSPGKGEVVNYLISRLEIDLKR
jgi:hypothetical protein